jgi:hypothetical protein
MHTLTLTLDLQLPAWHLSKLRAAIAERVGHEYELFHMHNNDPASEGEYHRHYPLIQYSLNRGYVQIIGINAGAEALQHVLLPKLTADWTINNQPVRIPGYQVRHREVELTLSEKTRSFRLFDWQGLNKKNYLLWDACRDDEEAQLQILSRALTGQLRAFAEGMGLPFYKAVEAKVTSVARQKRRRWHQTNLLTLDVEAESNLKIPPGIGLGRLTAYGFGRVAPVSVHKPPVKERTKRKSNINQ